METKNLNQAIIFKASPNQVYEALMDSKKHAKFTGDKAEISREVGGKISAYGGFIEGENLELVQDKKITQKWRCILNLFLFLLNENSCVFQSLFG